MWVHLASHWSAQSQVNVTEWGLNRLFYYDTPLGEHITEMCMGIPLSHQMGHRPSTRLTLSGLMWG